MRHYDVAKWENNDIHKINQCNLRGNTPKLPAARHFGIPSYHLGHMADNHVAKSLNPQIKPFIQYFIF
jgi:hypothetical protein